MRLRIAAVGRLKPGPEAMLVGDYLSRATLAGRALGLGPAELSEIDERKARDPASQAGRLLALCQPGGAVVALDERGRALSSPGLAERIAGFRDAGRPEATFLIGGADGHGRAALDGADLVLSLGPMVWPHMLARAMLAEQLYRAVSILAGQPYHRA